MRVASGVSTTSDYRSHAAHLVVELFNPDDIFVELLPLAFVFCLSFLPFTLNPPLGALRWPLRRLDLIRSQ